MYFKIDRFDCTPMVMKKSYSCNRNDVFAEWVDANGITHRNIYRHKVLMQCKIKPRTQEEYAQLCNVLKTAKSRSGTYPVTLFILNENTVEDMTAFIDCQMTVSTNNGFRQWFDAIEVRIEEI